MAANRNNSSQLTGAGVGLSGDSGISSNESSLHSSMASLISTLIFVSSFFGVLERSTYRDGWLGDAMAEEIRHGVVMCAKGLRERFGKAQARVHEEINTMGAIGPERKENSNFASRQRANWMTRFVGNGLIKP